MRKLGSLLAAAAVLAGTLVAAAGGPAAAGECDSPAVRDVTINQGVGSYERLAQGKEALVRLYLSLPSCIARGATITLDPASTAMTVSRVAADGSAAPLAAPLAPVSPSVTTAALVAFGSGPAVDAAADPKFVVPGAALVSPTGEGFTAGFSFQIGYAYKASKNATPVPGIVTVTTRPGTSPAAPIRAQVERRVAPLRVVVVGMGDASRDYSTQLTPTGVEAVQQGMHGLGRMLPVADGVGSLSGSGAPGIRYTITPSLIDLKSLGLLDADGKFCGTAGNFSSIKGTLAAFLTEWNAANPDGRADRVLGIADEAISYGAERNCADGWATVNGSVGWARAIPDRTGAPGTTGSLMAMELGHTLGLVPPPRQAFASAYHSPNTEADLTAPDRAYNLTSRGYLAADRTVMRITSGWNGTTTVFEQADWAFAQCALGGTVTAECTQYASQDATAGGISGEPVFVLSGAIGHTAGGHVAHVVDSHIATAWPTDPGDDDHVVLVQRSATGPLRIDNVPVAPEESSHHDHAGHGEVHEHDSGTFRVAVPLDPRTTRIELRSQGQLLYARQTSSPPVMSSGSTTGRVVGERNVSSDAAAEDTSAAVSPDGELIAWQRAGGIVIADADDPAKRATVAGASQPAIGPRHDPVSKRYSVAYVTSDGNIDMVEVDLSSGTPSVGTVRNVYLARPLLSANAPASHPTFSPDNSRIAFAADNDIVYVELVRNRLPCALVGALFCRPVPVATTSAVESWPTWAQHDAQKIGYVRGAEVVTRNLTENNPSDAAQATVLATKAAEPSWGHGVLAYRSTDPLAPGLFMVDTAVAGAGATRATTSAAHARPALAGGAGGTLAYDRPEGARRDVFVGHQRAVATWTVVDEAAADLVLTVLLSCGTDRRPLAVGLKPTSVSGTTATFTYEWDSVFGCAGGDVLGAASDGFHQSPPRSAGRIGGGTAPSPAIVAPSAGTVVRHGDVVNTQGGAIDAEDRALPGDRLAWELSGPAGTTSWSGAQRDLVSLAPGTYTLRLTATDSAGRVATTATAFTVIDEWVDVLRGKAEFDPKTLNIPSNGNTVTIYVTMPDLGQIDGGSVRLMTVDGIDVSTDDRFKRTSWSISGGKATAKFDRQALERFLYDEHGIFGRSVEVTVGGRTAAAADPAWRFFASDSTYVTR